MNEKYPDKKENSFEDNLKTLHNISTEIEI